MTQTVNLTEYVQAMKTVKRFKNLFMFLILVCLLFQANTFIIQEFTSFLESPEETQTTVADTSETAVTQNAEEPEESMAVQVYLDTLLWALPITKFAALACGVMLVISMMFAGALSLLGRGAGTPQLISTFFWSLILLAMLIPWQQIYASSKACGALFSYMDLIRMSDMYHVSKKTVADGAFFYGRFLAYPAVAFVVWLIVAFKFSGGYRKLISTESSRSTSAGM